MGKLQFREASSRIGVTLDISATKSCKELRSEPDMYNLYFLVRPDIVESKAYIGFGVVYGIDHPLESVIHKGAGAHPYGLHLFCLR